MVSRTALAGRDAERGGVRRVDAQRAAGVLLAPRRIADDRVGGERPPLAGGEHERVRGIGDGRRAGARARRAGPAARRGACRSGVAMRRRTSAHSSTANTTPDSPARIASNSALAASSGVPPNPARASEGPAASAARTTSPNTTAPSRSSSGRSSVRYRITGASAAEPRVVDDAHHARPAAYATRPAFAASRSGARSASVDRAERLDQARVDLGLGQRAGGRREQPAAQVEVVVRELEVEERRLGLLELGRRRQDVVARAARSRSSRRRSRRACRAPRAPRASAGESASECAGFAASTSIAR